MELTTHVSAVTHSLDFRRIQLGVTSFSQAG